MRPHSAVDLTRCRGLAEGVGQQVGDDLGLAQLSAHQRDALGGVESRDHEGVGRLRSSRRQPGLIRWHGGAAGEEPGPRRPPQLQTCREISAAVTSGRVKECVRLGWKSGWLYSPGSSRSGLSFKLAVLIPHPAPLRLTVRPSASHVLGGVLSPRRPI